MNRLPLAILIVAMSWYAFQASALAQEIAGVKCVVEGDRNAQEQFKADHADGEVFFCCQGCAAAFAADSSAYQTRANHQLVVTQQYQQTACPIAGEAFDSAQTAKVGGIEVAFCCENCKSKVEGTAKFSSKVEFVFGAEAFKRAFTKSKPETDSKSEAPIDLSEVKCLLQTKRPVKQEFVADYRGAKVYFCCNGCLTAFQADPAKYSARANMQLVSTEQYSQTACPLTDGDIDKSKTISVGAQNVALCCGSCLEKVETATEQERVAMIFGNEAFEKSFSKVEKADPEEYSVAPEELSAPVNEP